MNKSLNRPKLKEEILTVIENPTFWKVVDAINFRELIEKKYGYFVLSENNRKKGNIILKKTVTLLSRKEKLNRIDIIKHIKRDISVEKIESIYRELLHLLDLYFSSVWISSDLWLSDDGY